MGWVEEKGRERGGREGEQEGEVHPSLPPCTEREGNHV